MRILMTGITGLVGAGFATNLLRNNPDYTIVSLCRGFGNKSGLERTKETIKEQCELDGKDDAEELLSRIEIVEGTLEDFPADEMAAKGPYDTFFHCAASVNLGKDPDKKTYNTNFEGTKSALALAKKLGLKTFHYVGTAYVAGKCSGVVMEDSMPATEWNNSYERSKFDSEKLVRESGFDYTIYRPAIIVGRLSDGVIRKPLAFYRILEFLARVKINGCKKANLPLNGPFSTKLRLAAGTSDKIYFVPQDYVQQTIAKLFVLPVCNKTYHLTGMSPVSTQMIATAVCEALKTKGLVLVDEVEDPSKEEKLVQRMLDDLLPYFKSNITFDNTNVINALGKEVLDWKLDLDFLRKMVHAYYKENNPELL